MYFFNKQLIILMWLNIHSIYLKVTLLGVWNECKVSMSGRYNLIITLTPYVHVSLVNVLKTFPVWSVFQLPYHTYYAKGDNTFVGQLYWVYEISVRCT